MEWGWGIEQFYLEKLYIKSSCKAVHLEEGVTLLQSGFSMEQLEPDTSMIKPG